MTRARCMAYAFTVFALGALLSCAGVPTLCIKSAFLRNCFTHCNPHHPAHYAPQSTIPLSGAPLSGAPKFAVFLASAGASKCLSYSASAFATVLCFKASCLPAQALRKTITPASRRTSFTSSPPPTSPSSAPRGARWRPPTWTVRPLFSAFVATLPDYQGVTGIGYLTMVSVQQPTKWWNLKRVCGKPYFSRVSGVALRQTTSTTPTWR